MAALIAFAALFATFAPGALSADRDIDTVPSLQQFAASDFDDLAMSDASRAVAASISGRSLDPARFSTPSPALNPARNPQRGQVLVTPRAVSQSGPAWSGRALGIDVTAAPQDGTGKADWWLVGGAGQESYAVAPAGLREFTVAPVAAQTSVGDAHFGVGFKVSDSAYASLGYVREQRKFVLGAEDWEEDEHYVGVGFHARW